MRSFAQLFARFAARPKVARKLRIASLWREWPRLFADAPFDLGRPLGERDRVLVVGVEDPLAMQELSFGRTDILTRANEFLGEQCFDKVRFELIHGRASLGETQALPDSEPCRPAPLPRVGGLDLPPDTPLGRCYAKYIALAAERRGESAPGIRMKENGQ
ncbi:MAG: DUF721 domain-containing protein [Desulfovibrionaceae bacterium]|nr:DUF721 domain-containing protein [Desulfovibrionaceae bacterium]MBF0512438.1 DUF721 domain-containing protein [Desulfovibrionaceae bacterium]